MHIAVLRKLNSLIILQGDAAVEALVTVHVLPLDLQMSIGIGSQWSDNRQVVWLSSSPNTSILAEIPCITVRHFSH